VALDAEVIGDHSYNITLEFEYEDIGDHDQSMILTKNVATRNDAEEQELTLLKNFQSPLLKELHHLNSSHGIPIENEENLHSLRYDDLSTSLETGNSSPFPHDLLINIEEKISNFNRNTPDPDGPSIMADAEQSSMLR
jgi:hypothetical protein